VIVHNSQWVSVSAWQVSVPPPPLAMSVPALAFEGVSAFAAQQLVVALAALEEVGLGTTLEGVGAPSAHQGVGAAVNRRRRRCPSRRGANQII